MPLFCPLLDLRKFTPTSHIAHCSSWYYSLIIAYIFEAFSLVVLKITLFFYNTHGTKRKVWKLHSKTAHVKTKWQPYLTFTSKSGMLFLCFHVFRMYQLVIMLTFLDVQLWPRSSFAPYHKAITCTFLKKCHSFWNKGILNITKSAEGAFFNQLIELKIALVASLP